MAAPKKTTTKKAPAKKAPAKKTAAKKAPAAKNSSVTLDSLDARVTKLEQCDVMQTAKNGIEKSVDWVKGQYADNPALTIGVGVGVVLILMLLF